MQVKCPKCRFRYDVPVTPGAKELACVCQRCGTPFTYVMTEEEQQSVHQEAVSGVGGGSASNAHNQPSASSGGSNNTVSSYGGSNGEGNTSSSNPAGGYNGGSNGQRPYGMGQGRGGVQAPLVPPRRKGGCMRNCFVIFLVILAIIAFTVRTCVFDHSFTSDDLQDDDTEMTIDGQNSSDMSRISDDSPFAGINAEKAPKWLEGNWAVTTRNGSITITIRGNKIAESSNGQHSSGTFIYERGKLHCDFRDGEDNVRRVDEQNHRIDAGDGAWMHKTDYSDER